MKRIALLVIFGSVVLYSFAQIPVTITSNTDPGTLVNYIEQAQRYAQTIQNAIQELQTADQALQYQIQALQQLDSGTWNGFVKAWDMETGAINEYTALVAQLPSLSQIQAVSDLVQTQGYQAALSNMQTLQKNWGLASNIVHTTDTLVQNTAYRQQLWSQTLANSASSQSQGPVAQLQAVNQALALLGGEVADLNVNMGSWKDYFVAQVEQQQMQQKIQQQEADQFIEGNSAKNWTYQNEDWESLDHKYQ